MYATKLKKATYYKYIVKAYKMVDGKKGKTAQITAIEIKKDKKIKHHRNLCYESSNTKVVTVTSDGVIKAMRKGNCKIWVYAQNGVYKVITVTVK